MTRETLKHELHITFNLSILIAIEIKFENMVVIAYNINCNK